MVVVGSYCCSVVVQTPDNVCGKVGMYIGMKERPLLALLFCLARKRVQRSFLFEGSGGSFEGVTQDTTHPLDRFSKARFLPMKKSAT